MEIKIRNVDPVAVKKIDEMAKRKKVSRQEYLKTLVEKIAYDKEVSEKEARLEMVISKNTELMGDMINSMERMEKIMSELIEE